MSSFGSLVDTLHSVPRGEVRMTNETYTRPQGIGRDSVGRLTSVRYEWKCHSRPPSTAEANRSDLTIAEDAALSWLRQIAGDAAHPEFPDGPDQWEAHRSSAATGSGGPALI
jgi:hypothetical protein